MLRLLGDNGKAQRQHADAHPVAVPSSPKRPDRPRKASTSGLAGRKAILIFGYDYDGWEMTPTIAAFETLARQRVRLASRNTAHFADLIHSVHQHGAVFAWEIDGLDLAPQ